MKRVIITWRFVSGSESNIVVISVEWCLSSAHRGIRVIILPPSHVAVRVICLLLAVTASVVTPSSIGKRLRWSNEAKSKIEFCPPIETTHGNRGAGE